MAHAMNAAGVIFALFFVTACAIRRRNIFVMHQLLAAVVTVNAVERTFNRLRKTVRREKCERNLLALHDPRVLRVGVTIEAIRAGKFFNRVRRRKTWRGLEEEEHQQNQRERAKIILPAAEVPASIKSEESGESAHRWLRIACHFLTDRKTVRRRNPRHSWLGPESARICASAETRGTGCNHIWEHAGNRNWCKLTSVERRNGSTRNFKACCQESGVVSGLFSFLK